MNRLLKIISLSVGCIFLSSCGGQDEKATVPSAPAETVETPSQQKANNPLANQQQLIRDAKSIQGILDKDAEEKKKALKNLN